MLTLAPMPDKQDPHINQGNNPIPEQATNAANSVDKLLKWAPYIVILISAIVYSRALTCKFVFYDDDIYVLTNTYIKDCSLSSINAIFRAFYMGNYHPLTMVVYMIEYSLFGLNPLPYHALNLVLHLVNVFLAYKLAERLSNNKTIATIVCTLFALHPMHVESVAWVSETKDVLYSAFYLGATLAYLHYINTPNAKRYSYVIALFVAALLSKSAAVTLPALLLAIDYYKYRKLTSPVLLEKIPLFALSITFGIINIYAQRGAGAVNDLSLFFSPMQRFFLLSHNIAYYIGSVIAPVQLCSMHLIPVIGSGSLPIVYYISLPFVAFVLYLICRKSAIRRDLVFGLAFFLITISVMLQIVSVGSSLTAERYTYISYIGLFLIVGHTIQRLVSNTKTVLGIAALATLVCSLASWNRIGAWRDSDANFGDVIAKNTGNPNLCYAYWSLGNAKLSDDSLYKAGEYYIKAINTSSGFANAYSSLGYIYLQLGDNVTALKDENIAISINPKLADAYNNRGLCHTAVGNYKAALTDFDSAILLNARYAAAYCNRGALHLKMNNKAAALSDIETAINLDPDYADSYNQRGLALFASGNATEAINDFAKAIELKPSRSDAYFNRGWSYYSVGNLASALSDYNTGILLNPKNAVAYFNLASIKANTGDLQGALIAFDEGLKLDSADVNALTNRGIVRFNLKDTGSACRDWAHAAALGSASAKGMQEQYCK